jgi:hypothetical protein
MSVRCQHCGAVAGYGQEIGHKSDCPSLGRGGPMLNAENPLVAELLAAGFTPAQAKLVYDIVGERLK